jgi:hypothetical protein
MPGDAKFRETHTNVMVDRETSETLKKLIAQYSETYPFRQRPSKAGIIRILVARAATEGSGSAEVGPLPEEDQPTVRGPGRREFGQH